MDATFTVGTRVRVKIANNYADESGNYADGIVTREIPGGYRVRLDDGSEGSWIPGQMQRINVEVTRSRVEKACDWCGDLTPYAITVVGWTDHACEEHARKYFPGVQL